METVLNDLTMERDPDTELKVPKNILVTGDSGYLGRSLVSRLTKQGHNVFGLSRTTGKVDITSLVQVDKVLSQFKDAEIYHLAGKVSFNHRDKAEVYRTNVVGTLNLLSAAKQYKIKKIVVVSSACTVGTVKDPNHTKDEYFNEHDLSNAYVKSKAIIEKLSKEYGAITVAPTTCHIPDLKSNIVPAGGTNLIDREDAVSGMIKAMERGREGQKYILGGYNISYSDLYSLIGKRFLVAPRWTKNFIAFMARFDDHKYMSPYTVKKSFEYKYFNCNKAKKELGWDLKITLKEMLKLQS